MKTAPRLFVIAVLAFVALGVPRAALGVAWPSIASDLHRPIADLGTLVLVFIAGYMAANLTNGELTRRFGTGRLLVLSGTIGASSLVVYSLAGLWVVLAVAWACFGVSGGLADGGINSWVALQRDTRAMGLLHASFGFGATLGPLMITALLETGTSWRAGYAVLAMLQLGLTAAFVATRSGWDVADGARRGGVRPEPPARTVLLGSLVVFVLYTGVEAGAGQWAFTLFTEGRGMSEFAAGLSVTAYWASLTAGRLLLAAVGHRVEPRRVLLIVGPVAAAGLGIMWWNPLDWAGPLGFVFSGLALAPIFPLLTLLTPDRVGDAYAPWAIGYQLAAANVGVALIPGGLGVLVGIAGLGVVGPVLAIAAGCLAVAVGVQLRSTADAGSSPLTP